MRTEIQTVAQEFKDKVNKLKADLKALISGLPENPDITPLGGTCYSVSSSALNQHDNWSPSYYRFQSQYKTIIDEVIEKTPLERLETRMDEILKSGTVYKKNQGTIKLHPEVIKHLRQAWEA